MKKNKRLILEFTEFNAMRLNPDSSNMSIHVDNPQLSINAFDKHEDAIRSGVSKINSIIHSLSNSSNFRSLKSKLSMENQNIQSLKILRILKSNNIDYNVYVSFLIDGVEYFGVIEDVLGHNPQVKSEVFRDYDLVQTKEWIIKMKGVLINHVKNWLAPDSGQWKLLKDGVVCYSIDTGRALKLEKDQIIELVRSHDNKIIIKFNDKFYTLNNDNFIYFNYWFEKVIED